MSDTNNSDYQPVTLDELMSRCMGELQFAQNILKSFLDSCQDQLDDIRIEIESGETEVLAQKIHRLKGTAATVAARPLKTSLEVLETLVRSEKPDRTSRLREQFESTVDEYHKVTEYVESQLL